MTKPHDQSQQDNQARKVAAHLRQQSFANRCEAYRTAKPNAHPKPAQPGMA